MKSTNEDFIKIKNQIAQDPVRFNTKIALYNWILFYCQSDSLENEFIELIKWLPHPYNSSAASRKDNVHDMAERTDLKFDIDGMEKSINDHNDQTLKAILDKYSKRLTYLKDEAVQKIVWEGDEWSQLQAKASQEAYNLFDLSSDKNEKLDKLEGLFTKFKAHHNRFVEYKRLKDSDILKIREYKKEWKNLIKAIKSKAFEEYKSFYWQVYEEIISKPRQEFLDSFKDWDTKTNNNLCHKIRDYYVKSCKDLEDKKALELKNTLKTQNNLVTEKKGEWKAFYKKVDTLRAIKKDMLENGLVPQKYSSRQTLCFLIDLFENRRADSIKELINLYETELFRSDIKQQLNRIENGILNLGKTFVEFNNNMVNGLNNIASIQDRSFKEIFKYLEQNNRLQSLNIEATCSQLQQSIETNRQLNRLNKFATAMQFEHVLDSFHLSMIDYKLKW